MESDPIELRSATHDWMAPEQWHFTEQVRPTEDQRCRIGDAKKVDAFSFGKVCAWLLFWQQRPREIPDFGQNFDFDGALAALLRTKEAHSGELSNREFLAEITPLLSSFFAASYTSSPERREPVKNLTAKLDAILRSWELR